MEDGQSPPDADNHADERKGDPARRAGLRLRDAEAVATTRRDLFGDGSLVDVLAGNPDASAAGREPSDADAPAQAEDFPEEPPQPAAEAAGPQESPPSGDAESLDAIIDSFPDEPPQAAAEPASQADPSYLAASPFSFRPAEGAGQESPPRPGALERFQVSAIFQGLGPADAASADQMDGEAPPTDADAGEIAPEASSSPAGIEAPPQEDAATDSAESDNSLSSASAPQQGGADPAPVPGRDAWPPFPEPPVSSIEGGRPAREAGALSASAGMPPPMPHPSDWPPFPEPPGAQADPPLQQDTKDQPYLGTPAWPPLADMPGGPDDASAAIPAGLPPYIELPATPGSDDEQSNAEARGPSAFAGTAQPEPAEGYGVDADASPFPRSAAEAVDSERLAGSEDIAPLFSDAPTSPPPAHGPGETGEEAGIGPPDSRVAKTAAPPFAFDAAARASNETTAKIAAEANATARALNSLQHMLSQTLPPPEPSQPPAQLEVRPEPEAPFGSPHQLYHGASLDLRGAHAPFPDGEPAPYLPRPLSSDAGQGKHVYLLGFATGLVLSMVAGVALYVLLAMGN